MLTRHRWSVGLLIAGLALILMGAAPPAAEEKPAEKAEGAAGEPAARIVEVTPEHAEKGKMAFQKCATCHGSKAEGRVGMAPSLASRSFLEAATDQMLLTTMARGRLGTTMVPFSSALSLEEMKSIVAFLRNMNPTKPAKLDESPLKGDVKRGMKTYRTICSGCHGRSGAGYMESGAGTGIGRKAFLETVSNGFLRYVIKEGKTGTMMRPFTKERAAAVADLTDQQIEDVLAFLRDRAW